MKNKFLVLIVGVFILTIISLWLVFSANKPISSSQKKVFPEFTKQISQCDTLSIETTTKSFLLKKQEKNWVLQSHDSYPVKNEAIRAWLLQLADIQFIETKTNNSDLYYKIGVQDIKQEKGNYTTIKATLSSQNETKVSFYVGINPSLVSAAQQFYFRNNNDPQAWLVEALSPLNFDIMQWLDRSITHLKNEEIKSVRVQTQQGEVFSIEKPNKETKDFRSPQLVSEQIKNNQYDLNLLATSLEFLEFSDVKSSKNIPTSWQIAGQIRFILFSGENILFKLFHNTASDSYWLQWLEASQTNKEKMHWLYQISNIQAKRMLKTARDFSKKAPTQDKVKF